MYPQRLALLICIGATAHSSDLVAQTTAARKVVTSSVDYVVPPEATVAERLASVDAVALVQVLGQPSIRARDLKPILEAADPGVLLPEMIVPITEYNVRIVEVMKSHSSVEQGRTITVGGQGGRLTRGGVDHVTEGLGYELSPGATYILFLQFNEALGIFTTTPFDVFRVDGPRVSTTRVGLSTLYGKEIGDKPTPTALARVRAAARRQ
jgi:hypothetical protein